ncbi:MAG: hypothetical protein IJE65_05495 [Clostridia bacterium]|nr:hypothetical protein [Clostridia bacterium]
MKEFFKENKKSVIMFLSAVVVIIACAIVGSILNPEDENAGRIGITDGETATDISAQEYEVVDGNALNFASSEAESVAQ